MLRRLIPALAPLMACAALSAQSSTPREAQSVAIVSGRVRRTDTGGPVDGATVRLSVTHGTSSRSANCDEFGRFEFADVPPGEYWLTAAADNLVSASATPARPVGIATPIAVAAGKDARNIEIALAPMRAITGRLLDPSGAPLPDVSVVLPELRQVPGTQIAMTPLSPNLTARTDADGRYRFFPLPPGDYYVMALVGPFGRAAPMDPEPVPDRLLGYVPTFFPGADRLIGARPVRVELGRDPPDVIFSVIPAELVKMSGTVSDVNGRPVATASLMLIPSDGASLETDLAVVTRTDADGRFTYPAVPAGRYVLQTFGRRAFDSRPIVLAPSKEAPPVIDVMVRPLVAARGHVTFEGDPPPEKKSVQISFVATDFVSGPIGGNPLVATIADDWTFEIANLASTGIIRATAPPGWALKSINLNGRDISTQPSDFQSADVNGLELVMTNRLATLTGTVTDGNKPASFFTVLMWRADTKPGTMALQAPSAPISTGPGGAFAITGLLAGRYQVIALPAPFNIRDLGTVMALGTPINVAEGETKTIALKLLRR